MSDMDSMIRALIETRSERWQEAKALQERGNLSEPDARHFDALVEQINELDERIEELHTLNTENKRADEARQEIHPGTDDPARWQSVNMNAGTWRKTTDEEIAVRDFLSGKGDPVVTLDFTGIEHRRNDAGRLEVRALNTSTASSAFGQDFRRQLYEHMVEANVLMSAGATVINTNHGRDIVVPKTTAEGTASVVGEGSAITGADGGFGSTSLGAWKFANYHTVTNELIQDAEIPLLSYLSRDMGRSVGLASGSDFLVGTGTNQPTGLTVVAGTAVAGTVASGVDASELYEMAFSVATPYRERGSWIMNASTFKAIAKLVDANNNYLIGNLADGAPARLLGRPVFLDPAMPALGSTNISIAFGDLAAYHIRSGPMEIRRSDDFLFSSDSVALRVTYRADGDLVDLTGAVEVYEGD